MLGSDTPLARPDLVSVVSAMPVIAGTRLLNYINPLLPRAQDIGPWQGKERAT